MVNSPHDSLVVGGDPMGTRGGQSGPVSTVNGATGVGVGSTTGWGFEGLDVDELDRKQINQKVEVISTHSLDIRSQHTLSTHPLNIPSQHISPCHTPNTITPLPTNLINQSILECSLTLFFPELCY